MLSFPKKWILFVENLRWSISDARNSWPSFINKVVVVVIFQLHHRNPPYLITMDHGDRMRRVGRLDLVYLDINHCVIITYV